VRGDEWNSVSTFNESTVSDKVIVTDTVTDLIWQKEYSGTLTWVNALNYCEDLSYAGYTDWRLPNIEELKTLVNDSIYYPASSFPGMPSSSFWSSSSYAGNPNIALRVDFYYGYVYFNFKSERCSARCVR